MEDGFMRSFLFLLGLQLLLSGHLASALQCIGEDGLAVDWWLALKAPGTDKSGNTKYGYIDNNNEVEDGAFVWREGTQISGNSSNPPADTLAPLYQKSQEEVGYVIWNDEPGASHCPKGCTSFVLGHSKGTLGFDQEGGFWLSHSVPKYPDSPKDSVFTGIQVGQTLNGQSFGCISLSVTSLNKVARVLKLADLNIYSPHSIPSKFKKLYPDLSKLASTALGPSGPVKPEIALSDANVTTLNGQVLRVFAKSSTGDDGESVRMWEDVVEEGLKAPMLVQSWPEGGSKDLPSYCGPPESDYKSLTITSLSLPSTSLSWTTRAKGHYRDHSKWGITTLDKRKHAESTFCIGDNNRAIHQNVRGGTAICFIQNKALYNTLKASINGSDSCDAEL